MHSFLIALQFLTRLPLNINVDWQAENVARSLLWYPVVGALIGAMLFLLASVMPDNHTLLVAALVLSGWVLVSGGLHLDGLADSADAWLGSHGDRQRALDIMKDPQAGPAAVIALVLVLLLKFGAIVSLLEHNAVWLLIVPPLLARCVPLILFMSTDYVRDQGLGRDMAEYFPHSAVQGVLLLAAIALLFLTGILNGLLLMAVALLVIWWLRALMIKHIGGMTGDTLGASIEIIEVVVLSMLVFLVSEL
ncbi:Cobalamin synthase [hydrothermal vent metagenome]|uniref:Adenosylcobinamide-GDP ribazoletransferase n=1 Tax=hydrothermal vent metagenome TaxID=652676 RepID=A0A3B0X6Y8_9ZZZZ